MLQSKTSPINQVAQPFNQQHNHFSQAIQQRQILAQMGVDCWVTHNTQKKFVTIDELLDLLDVNQLVKNQQTINLYSQADTQANNQINSQVLDDQVLDDQVKTADDAMDIAQPVPEHKASTELNLAADLAKTEQKLVPQSTQDSKLVVPFELQGVSFANWVLLVDMETIAEQELTLWNNICRALQLDIQTIKFPLISNHNTVEVANAALTGFIFRLAKSEKINIANLTQLPDGVEDKRLASLPTLQQMLGNPASKQAFWQALKHS